MKRVLLITYSFPPQASAGALRPGYLGRYLPEYGWEVSVVTRASAVPPFSVPLFPAGKASVAQRQDPSVSNRPLLRRALGKTRDTLAFPDELVGWIPMAVRAGMQAVRSRHFDAVLSTALPMSAHVAAWYLSKRTGLPWIADYRDAWSGNPYMPWGPLKSFAERTFEQFLIRHAAAVTTVSEPIAKQLERVHSRTATAIPNGYDEADWQDCALPVPQSFDLIYAGNLYDGKRSPEMLFQALRELQEVHHPAGGASVHFYTVNNIGLHEAAQRHGVSSQIFIHGFVPRPEVLRRQREAAVLLILLNADPRTENETGSKYLEYLGARRPMLVCGSSGSVMRSIVSSSGLGWYAATVEEAKRALIAAYGRFAGGQYEWTADLASIPTARDLARRFAQQLETVSTANAQGWQLSAEAEYESAAHRT